VVFGAYDSYPARPSPSVSPRTFHYSIESLSVFWCVSAERLSEYVQHYEPLSYATADVHATHLRVRRSVTRDHAVHLKFNAHGRNFHLRLKRDLDTFSDRVQVVGPTGELENADVSHIYQGHIVGK